MASKKRTKVQVVRDRARIAELALQKHTQNEIIEILEFETGIRLSQQQISYDLSKVKDQWLNTQYDSYNLMMMRELSRIDALESEIWRALRESVEPREYNTIEKARRKMAAAEGDEAEYDMVVTKTKEVIEQHSANPSYFAQILSCQQERRKLLGLYAPQQIGVQKTIVVKGYKEISPDDWDHVIEGELVS